LRKFPRVWLLVLRNRRQRLAKLYAFFVFGAGNIT
jgi:hypothetical protein